jgi:serine/threonine protein kinase
LPILGPFLKFLRGYITLAAVMNDEMVAGRFQPERLLARGGMSEVWVARDPELERQVAIKLRAVHADANRFECEARAVARLSHPNIVKLFDYGLTEHRSYLLLEYLPGGSLEDRLTPGKPLDDEHTERIAREVAAGLAHAHDHGVIHRDLKPSNVLFDAEGCAKIADFGIARADGQTTLTAAGTMLGTAAYLSPEQATGEPVGPASDVYSFGTILFRLLTGRLPFEGESAVELALKRRSEPAPSVETFRPDAPRSLSLLCAAALAKEPEARPGDGNELLAVLDDSKPPSAALAATETAELQPRSRRRRLAPLLLLGLVALGGLLTGLYVVGDADAPPTPAPATTQHAETTPSDAQQSSTAPATTGASTTQSGTTVQETSTSNQTPVSTATEPNSSDDRSGVDRR